MAELIHVSKVRIIKDKGPLRRAWIENFPDPVVYGVHGGIKKFYGVEPEQEAPTTLVTRIKVRYTVKVPKGKRADALRAIEVH